MLFGLASNKLWSQPIGYNTPLATNGTNVLTTANTSWYRGGNQNNGPAGNANIFGTRWNSGIYTMTNGQYRMKLNGSVNYDVNGFTGNRDGYLLLGATSADNYINNFKGAWSLLHLNGKNNSVYQPEVGYRPWMQTGITLTDNDDLSYFGMRKVGNPSNLSKSITETTICWSNDVPGDYGPDDMVFRFLGGNASPNGSTISNVLTTENDLDGRHVARFTNDGLMGLGNTFGVNGPGDPVLYARPQSLLHLSFSSNSGIWSQYTNRGNATGTTQGTGEAVSDGLRIGIFGSTNNNVNGIAAIYNQENRPMLFSTGANTFTMNPLNGESYERVRIMSANTPTFLLAAPLGGSFYGQYNPAGVPANTTRFSISHNPTNPVTRPLSLLHIGYNTTNPNVLDGWRPWMDVGMFVSNKSDHVYLGLKNETNNNSIDRQDAVLGWGDNAVNTGGNGPENLRFIFTSVTTATQSPANSMNGLEVARMIPNTATTLATPNSGMMGIGNFSSPGPNAAAANQVNAKLDIDGDLRIRTVTPDNNLTQILFIDPTDKNRVHYRDVSTLATLGAPGNYCTLPNNPLTSFYKIPLNDNNHYFEGQGGANNSVGIGHNCNALRGKLDVYNTHKPFGGYFVTQTFGSINPVGMFISTNGSTNSGGNAHGILAFTNVSNSSLNYGVLSLAGGGSTNYGIYGSAPNSGSNRAGFFNGMLETTTNVLTISDQQFKTNVTSITSALDLLKQLKPHTYYMDTLNYTAFNFDSRKQFGFIAQELESVIPEVVHTGFHPGTLDSTGISMGDSINYKTVNYTAFIPINTQAIKELNTKFIKQTLSDQSIKTNVNNLTGSLEKVLAMRGVSFNWNQNLMPDYALDNIEHVGFIAQEINAVDPRLTFISDENLMHVDYNKIVPIAVEAIQELNGQIALRDSIITSLNDRLTHLENCLSGILPFLCQISNSSIQPTQEVFQQQLKNEINVQLSSKNTIILNQNVPNPFAEQTQISFSIPETVKKAQIHFYDANGKLINSVEVQERGLGQLNVFANDLSTGVYTYTLVADGQIVATKKMMKQ